MNNEKTSHYLLPVEFLEKFLQDCERDLRISLFNVQYFSNQDTINEHLLSLLCESYCLSVRIKEAVVPYLEDSPRSKGPDNKMEVTMPAEKVMVLQALVYAKKQLMLELGDNPDISVWEN